MAISSVNVSDGVKIEIFIVILFNLVAVKGERPKGPETYIDPAMIGVLVGMALMFVIICVVLRLFSQ